MAKRVESRIKERSFGFAQTGTNCHRDGHGRNSAVRTNWPGEPPTAEAVRAYKQRRRSEWSSGKLRRLPCMGA